MTATITDLFCGAGGSSIGAEMAGGELRLALNHWERAIETHATNFQHADHDCNDVAALTTAQIRRYPHTDILLASPECTNHSLAKGARRRKPQAASLWEDGPASDKEQDRSRATMFDVWRFAEQKQIAGHPYKAIVVENVVDAWKWGPNDDGQLFQSWLGFGHALGYQHEIVWLNSMFAGSVPQSRDRMYVVWWLKGMRRPNLKVEPVSWCPGCEQLVDGRQSWKKPERPWGRYGAQYFFACPECNGSVLPGVHPAATAIDWSLPAERIGDRARPLAPNTRKRIRRGLEKLAGQDFAIRLTHGGAPKPLTLPIVTLTQRHDMAMVVPVAGNTHERTPGHRARDAETRPLDTVHGTLDRAMVVPPMGSVAPRDAFNAPAPTQPTTTRPALVTTAGGGWSDEGGDAAVDPLATQTATESKALVMANTENGVPRPADREPAQTLRTEGGLGMVMANRANNVPKDAAADPSPAILTGETVGVVMRNNTARGDDAQMSTPTHESVRTLTAHGAPQSLLIPYDSTGQARVAGDEPTQTLTTRDRLAMVVPFTRNGRPRDADYDVTPTATAEGPPAVVLREEDIDACRFRMFQLHEIAAAMAMTDKSPGTAYEVLGNKRERMAQYGNAVTPPAMELLVRRLLEVIG
jgi:DNA (cytosine-5)-methyltransferase 1